MSRIFFPAEREPPSASKGWAASARCSALRVFLVPNQEKLTRTAAMPSRRFSAGVWALLAELRGFVEEGGHHDLRGVHVVSCLRSHQRGCGCSLITERSGGVDPPEWRSLQVRAFARIRRISSSNR